MEDAHFPEFSRSDKGESDLRKGFTEYVESDKFCSVDLLAVIQDAKWQAFFSPKSSASQMKEGGAGKLDVNQGVVGKGNTGEKGDGNQILKPDGKGKSKYSSK